MSAISILFCLCLSSIRGQVVYVNGPANRAAAEADCQARGSNLLTAQGNTADINECLNAAGSGGAWIGLTRNSNTWSWSSGTSYIQNQVNWSGNGPKNNANSADCAILITSGSKQGQISNAAAASCSNTRQYCCDPIPSTASPTKSPVTAQPTQPTQAPVTASPTTASPTLPPTCGRERKEWNTATQAERDLYINGLLALSAAGKLQIFTQQHGQNAAENQAHGRSGFLPWHRLFLFELESQIRALGGQYECFALLYWNWGLDRDLYGANFDSYSILNSGLGGRGDSNNNYCVSGNFGPDNYTPQYCPSGWVDNQNRCCLRRVTSTSAFTSIYSSVSNQNAVLSSSSYGSDTDGSNSFGIKDQIEYGPHGTAHCTMGGCGSGHLGNGLFSPDDPIFYLLHAQVDLLWALWQDYHNYEQVDKSSITSTIYYGGFANSDIDRALEFDVLAAESWSVLTGTETIRDMHSISDMGYKYEYGSFFDDVSFPTANLDSNWFYEDVTRRRRRLNEDSMRFDRVAYGQLVQKYGKDEVNTYDGRRKLVGTLAKMSCEFDNSGGYECERPAYFDDCSDMERGPNLRNNKMDIDITLDELISKVSDYPCMVETRKLMYEWVAQLGGLWRLCRGDFDRFCDREFLRKRPKKNQCEARGYSRNNKRSESVVFDIDHQHQVQPEGHEEHDISYWEDKFMDAIANGVVLGAMMVIVLFIWMYYKQWNMKNKGYNKVDKYIDNV